MVFIHSLRVDETVRVVSALQGEDYFVLKAAHMLPYVSRCQMEPCQKLYGLLLKVCTVGTEREREGERERERD